MLNLVVVAALLAYAHWRFGQVKIEVAQRYEDL